MVFMGRAGRAPVAVTPPACFAPLPRCRCWPGGSTPGPRGRRSLLLAPRGQRPQSGANRPPRRQGGGIMRERSNATRCCAACHESTVRRSRATRAVDARLSRPAGRRATRLQPAARQGLRLTISGSNDWRRRMRSRLVLGQPAGRLRISSRAAGSSGRPASARWMSSASSSPSFALTRSAAGGKSFSIMRPIASRGSERTRELVSRTRE
jgi:hypothetical protein